MSNKQKLIPLKEAADLVSYSRDYVAKLAREKKIVAEQFNRQWMVSLESLENFAQISEYEKKIRHQELSQQRKLERVVKEKVQEQENRVQSRINKASTSALQFCFAVLLAGVFFGFGLFGFSGSMQPQFSEQLAGLIMPAKDEDVVVEQESLPSPTSEELTINETLLLEPVFEPTVSHDSIAPEQSMVVLAKNDLPIKTVEEVKNLFSDEVVVSEDDTGDPRVFATNKQGEAIGRGLPLLTIPMLKNAKQKI